MEYESIVVKESAVCAGVRYRLRRMTFGRRVELTRRVRDALGRLKFVEAGERTPEEEATAAILAAEIDAEYLRWGLAEIDGLEIDGQAATPEGLIEAGPEDLTREALEFVTAEAGLNGEERKNSWSPSTSLEAGKPGGVATNAAA